MTKNQKIVLGSVVAILLVLIDLSFFRTKTEVYVAPSPSVEPSPVPKITHCLDVNNNELPMSACAKG